MNEATVTGDGAGVGLIRRLRQGAARVGIAVLVACVLTLTSACGGSGSLSAAGSSSPSASPPPSKQGALLAYAHCMRQHGDEAFPDPISGPGGGTGFGDVDTASAAYRNANRACVSELPGGAAQQRRDQAQFAATALQFARCMRVNGIADFPDPSPNGEFPEDQMRGLGKGSAPFSAAQRACQHYLNAR